MVKKAKVKKRVTKIGIGILSRKQAIASGWNISEETDKLVASYTPSPILTLCGQLEDAILLLENRISNSIAKINSLM